MSEVAATIAASRAYCHRAARRAGSNFYPCFLLLPRPQREAMEALYAFMRHTDDLGDNAWAICERRAALACWRENLCAALENRGPAAGAPFAGNPFAQLLPALADAVRRYGIPAEHLLAVLDGVEMDLAGGRYESFEELEVYCHRVASAVGLACIHIWGFHGSEASVAARQCGVAFQLTNILRDLKEDLAQGRLYLPLADLRACDYTEEDLARGITDARFHRLMTLEIGRARLLYRQAADLFDALAAGGRRVFGMMWATYSRLLDEIERRPQRVFEQRVRLGRWRKLWIASRWAFLPAHKPALP